MDVRQQYVLRAATAHEIAKHAEPVAKLMPALAGIELKQDKVRD